MNILDATVNAQDGAAVQQLGSFQPNIQSQGGLESLMAALSSGNHGQYIDNPTSLADPSAV